MKEIQCPHCGTHFTINETQYSELLEFELSPEDVPAFVQALPGFSALRVRGLMTLARQPCREPQ